MSSNFVEITKKSVRRFSQANASEWAGAITFYAFLSIPAILSVVVWIVSRVIAESTIEETIRLVQSIIPSEEARDIVQALFARTTDFGSGIASLFALGIALFSASNIFTHLSTALSRIWQFEVNQEGGKLRRVAKKRLRSLLPVLVVGASAVILVLVFAVLQAAAPLLSEWFPISIGVIRALGIIGFVLLMGVASGLVFWLFSARRFSVRLSICVGMLTSALLVIGQLVLALYFQYTNVGSGFGALGSVVIFLVWMNYSVRILLFGAAVLGEMENAADARSSDSSKDVASERKSHPTQINHSDMSMNNMQSKIPNILLRFTYIAGMIAGALRLLRFLLRIGRAVLRFRSSRKMQR